MPSVSGWIDAGRRIAGLVASYDDKLKVLELVARAADLQAENEDLRRKVRELGEELARKKKLETMSGATYILEDDGSRTGPICKACYDERDLVVRLVRFRGGSRCVNCGNVYPGVGSELDDPKAQRASW